MRLPTQLRLLSDPTRLRLVRLLAERPLTVSELRVLLHTSQSSVSQHLAKLRAAGWVEDERLGQHIRYHLNASRVGEAKAGLEHLFCTPLGSLPLLENEWHRWREIFGDPVTVELGAQPDRTPRVPRNPVVILFVCTGNSARSQMAEGFARVLGGPQVRPHSAGLEPAGLHPLAIAVMAEVGVDISRQTSKAVTTTRLADANVVVTLCGERPAWRPCSERPFEWRHWPLPDPVRADGPRHRRMARFREVRDLVRTHTKQLLTELHVAAGA